MTKALFPDPAKPTRRMFGWKDEEEEEEEEAGIRSSREKLYTLHAIRTHTFVSTPLSVRRSSFGTVR